SSRRVTTPSKPAQTSTAAKVSDDIVRRAQQALERAGYEIGTPDGQLGPRTIAAVKRFQTDRYLAVSGQLDESTLAALGIDTSSSANSLPHITALTDPVNALTSISGRSGTQILAATNSG